MACLASVGLLAVLAHRASVHSSPSGDTPSESSDSNSVSVSAESPAITQPAHDSPKKAGINDSSASPHGAQEACDICHDSKTPDESKAQALARQVPKLCFRCHEDESKTYPYVHGPVAVGQCLFCHNPHQSKHTHLLNHDIRELCTQCHTQEDLHSIKDHLAPSHAQCLECHTSHGNTTRHLLKHQPEQAEASLQ